MEAPSSESGGASVSPSETTKNPAAAKPKSTATGKVRKPPIAKKAKAGGDAAVDQFKLRRHLTWTAIVGFLATGTLMVARFFFPRTLFEPSSRFRIGYPSDFPIGVDERFKQSNSVWVVRQPDKLFVIYARCTHLGCIPNWIETENKFKCPCHGSGYDPEGRNFEGPAPRPMDRTAVELDAEGQIVVDTSRLYACPPGAACQFDEDEQSYLSV
jgi:cytochrome b6-f complex iron-sulfur subunit